MNWIGRFQQYDAAAFRKDLIAGIVVGIIAVPLGMAFAIASGVKPEYGIYTTIIAGVLISLLGGSKFQIGGPTGAFVPILLAIVLQYGYENLLIAGCLAGILLVLMGVFKLGAFISFIPRPVTIGFTAGIAIIIFSGQLSNFLGLTSIKKHEYFIPNMKEIIVNLEAINIYSILTAFVCLAAMLLSKKVLPKVPHSLVGLVLSSLVATLLFKENVATIGSVYGEIPSTLPQFQIPEMTWDRIKMLIQPAFIIAFLGGIESLLSAVVADEMTKSRHHSNRELIGQGIANIVTPLFGGIPATGAIARTATNIKNGAVSPISGVIHSITVLLILLLLAPFASHIPLASMAPILMLVAWNMSQRKEFLHILKTKTGDSFVLLVTFILTVLTNLTIAVEVGLAFSIILFLKRMHQSAKVTQVLPDLDDKRKKVKPYLVSEAHGCPQFRIFTLEGALFYGSPNLFEKVLADARHSEANIILLRMSRVPYMDTTSENKLERFITDCKELDITVLISGIQAQPMSLFKKTGLLALIGDRQFFEHTGEAIDYALTTLDLNRCIGCKHFAFHECKALSSSAKSPSQSWPLQAKAAANSYSPH